MFGLRFYRFWIERIRPRLFENASTTSTNGYFREVEKLVFFHTTRMLPLTKGTFKDAITNFFQRFVRGSPRPTPMALRHVFATLLYNAWYELTNLTFLFICMGEMMLTYTNRSQDLNGFRAHRLLPTRECFLEWCADHLNTSKEQLLKTYISESTQDLLTGLSFIICFLCVFDFIEQ